MGGLRWGGNQEAQRQADEAYAKLKGKKPKARKRKKKHKPASGKPVDYHQYLSSEKWKRKRAWVFRCKPRKCEVCESTEDLRVCHVTFERLGRERLEDLKVLCLGCQENELEGKVPGVFDPLSREFQQIIGER